MCSPAEIKRSTELSTLLYLSYAIHTVIINCRQCRAISFFFSLLPCASSFRVTLGIPINSRCSSSINCAFNGYFVARSVKQLKKVNLSAEMEKMEWS